MRKKINLIVCIIIVACVALFAVACAPKDADGLIKLSTPSNLELNGSVLSWGDVKNAEMYFISVDGVETEQSVTSTTCDLSTMVTGYGNFSIEVRAYGDGKKYGTSDKSAAIVYHKGNALATPEVTVTDKVASWKAIENAVNYSVKVFDEKGGVLDELTTESLTYTFEKKNSADASGEAEDKDVYEAYGAYRISVIANPASDNIEYSASVAGTATYYNATVLSVPKFTDMTGSTIRWGEVAYATNYTLRVTFEDDSFQEAEVSGTSYSYRTKFDFAKVGKYVFTIKANGDNQVYYSSQFSENDDEYVVNKLAAVDPQDMRLKYEGEVAKLSWKLPADSLATEFTLDLSAYLPDGTTVLNTGSVIRKTISNDIKFVEAEVYDFYKYNADGSDIEKVDGVTVLVYNYNGKAKVRYEGNDYFLKDKEDKDVEWKDYKITASVDIVYDSDANKFVNDSKIYNDPDTGAMLDQNTGGDKVDVIGTDGKKLFYFATVDGEDSELEVAKSVTYGDDGEVEYHIFELVIDDIFIKKSVEDGVTKYDYTISDKSCYGLLYNVSIIVGEDTKNYLASQSVTADGQYLSYMIPEEQDGKYVVTNTGEYAYIILHSFVNPANTDKFSIEDNINFNGHEVVQIETFSGNIDGNNHTVSGIVIGNKVLTQNGVLKNDDVSDLEYSMFVNIDNNGDTANGIVQNVFYVGVGFIGYDKDKLGEGVGSIKVAPIAINNGGSIRNVLVQSDSIKAEGAQVAGMVINNNGYITTASVYADLEGATVGGVAITNGAQYLVANVGFYGKVTATLSDILAEGVTSIGGAGLVVDNDGVIEKCFAIGDVSVSATGLDSVYAGGLVASNNASGVILKSYSGEFTLNNVGTTVVANGDNSHAGGFVAQNKGEISSCYATGKATASMYAGGFVGYNEASITSCYSTGGTARTGENRGSFVGKNADGSIVKCIAYSTDSWAEDAKVEVLKSSEKLADIVTTLYGEGDTDMVVMRDNGYRNPLIKGVIYTKENIVTIRPSQTVDTKGVIFTDEAKDVTSTLYGDKTKKGNRIVVELSFDGYPSRYVYGYVK